MKYSLAILLIVCSCWTISAQFSLGITIGGIAIHQEKSSNASFYTLKLDKRGYVVAFGGITFSLSYRINDFIGIKGVQSIIFHDSAGKWAGISHVGIDLHDDFVGMKNEDHHLSMSIGPFWYYRKGWADIPEYQNEPGFITLYPETGWERKFVWYGGFLRYNYRIDQNMDFALDVLPGFPFVYAFSGGISTN